MAGAFFHLLDTATNLDKPGGYTFPLKNPVIVNIASRVNTQLCTWPEAQKFLGFVLMQGDIVPYDSQAYIRELSRDELYVAAGFAGIGALPLVLEFAGPRPGSDARDVPPKESLVVPSQKYPYTFSVLIGTMYASAPQVPGSQSSLGPQAFRSDLKLQVKADGSLVWVGLDQPTWQGNVTTGA